MLLTSMDVDAEHDLDFNRWYDREHIAERVAIPGFVEARRYIAENGNPKYLSLYSTKTFDVLDSPDYRTALANQTAWSKANIARFKDMIRAVARITVSRGQGRGAALGIIRLRGMTPDMRPAIEARCAPELHDGVISMSLLESDPALSRSLTNPSDNAGSADWYVLVEGTSIDAVAALTPSHFATAIGGGTVVSSGTYRLMFDLAAADL
jgi:hypothetical protein